ncbi:cAMP-binding protein [Leptospira kobayashii]|uniref:cAMP-binding protein n=1 Tax=Leptospira kobayashii TaxID=1917830 RepID=A0ABM7ULF9_9LEPT|nr:cyclic nucleotide-binding domain-containing protein [Leptospira kobayashii]BDA79800.1 cAMP-binding protein [Leptospira kobayashii]
MQLPLWKSILKRDDNPITEISHFLRETAIFQGLPRRTLREVARLIHKRKYYAGETIFFQGQAGTGVYLILSGKVEISSQREGITLKLAELEKGAFFGELALFQDIPRSATAVAVVDSILLGFFQPELKTLLETKPRVGNDLLLSFAGIIADRLRKTNDTLETAYFKSKRAKKKNASE